jgi:hypothetical protein
MKVSNPPHGSDHKAEFAQSARADSYCQELDLRPVCSEQRSAVTRISPELDPFSVMSALAAAGPGGIASWSIADDDDAVVEWPGPDGRPIRVHLFCGRNRGAR